MIKTIFLKLKIIIMKPYYLIIFVILRALNDYWDNFPIIQAELVFFANFFFGFIPLNFNIKNSLSWVLKIVISSGTFWEVTIMNDASQETLLNKAITFYFP